MRLLLKYSSRRAHLVRDRIANWQNLASGEHEIHWLLSGHDDDPAMCDLAMSAWCAERGIELVITDARTKVANYNAGINDTSWPWDACLLISDDMRCTAKGWDKIVADEFAGNFDCGLWAYDGRQTGICTLSIFGRAVYEGLMGREAYNSAFESLYCDNYYTELLMNARKMKRCAVTIFNHDWRVLNDDALMRQTESADVYRRDYQTYLRLKAASGLP